MRRPIEILAAAALALCVAVADAGEGAMRVTMNQPVVAPVTDSGTPSRLGVRRLVLEVVGYAPSPSGPVVAVVAAECAGEIRELGRFGVFPDQAFTASDAVEPQRFGFALPSSPGCESPGTVVIRLDATLGDGAGAVLTIGAARIE